MANIKSAKKRILVNKKAELRNKSNRTAYKTARKKALNTEDKKPEVITADLNSAYKAIDMAASKGAISKKKASRIKSRTAIAQNKKNEVK